MKVGVILHWNEGEASGVFKKAISQITTWTNQGVQVSLHLICRRGMLNVWQRYLKGAHIAHITIHVYRGVVSRFRAWGDAAKALQAQRPDLIYQRYDLYMPALKRLARAFPLVLEINSNDLVEYCLTKSLRCCYNRLTRSLLLRNAAGFSFVTWELAKLPDFSQYQKPYAVISNGVKLTEYCPLAAPSNQETRLIFLGTDGQPWQGVDKILKMANLFPEWRFEIVGIQPNSLGAVPSNVHIHGPLKRPAYERLLALSHIAIGTLALHRKRLNEACPLKVREYLAYGLPVIIGYTDTDFPRGAPFILQLPNTEDNIQKSATAIASFVKAWKGRRVPREAISHLDVSFKEAQRLVFFRSVLEGRRR